MPNLIKAYGAWLKMATSRVILLLICLAATSLLAFSAIREAAIMDELAHIPAGYGYVRYLDFRLNPEHPPLLKALSAYPLLFLNFTFPTNDPSWQVAINGQWDMGSKMLYGFGNNADEIVRTARIFPILLTILLILLVYAMAKERIGNLWALLPTILIAFSPIVLAHGHYVTTDIAATFGILLALWRFISFLETPSKKNLWLAGLAFGVAQALKFSTVLLIPYFIGLTLLHLWLRKTMPGWSYIKKLFLVFIIGYSLVIYPVYALFTWNYPIDRQYADTAITLNSFAGGPTPEGSTCSAVRCLADLTVWMSKTTVLRPLAQYSLGVLMVMQRADGGNTAYFLGQVSSSGSRLYFPASYALKETLPALIILITGTFLALRNIFRSLKNRNRFQDIKTYVRNFFPEISWLGFIIFYWAYSMKSPLNIGVRHILPTIPLMYLLGASAWKRWVTKLDIAHNHVPIDFVKAAASAIGRAWIKSLLLLGLLIWVVLEALIVAPHFLSYFNQLSGGTWSGYRYVTDSNYDWGQDLLELKEFVNARPEIDKIAVDYFGGGSSTYYLEGKAVPWWSAKGDPREEGIKWLAISANAIQGGIQPVAEGFNRKAEDSYPWLMEGKEIQPGMGGIPTPDHRVGTSIFIYEL